MPEAVARDAAQPYSGTIAVMRSRETPWPQPDLGWKTVGARIDIREISGDHTTCLTTHLRGVGEVMRECVDYAERMAALHRSRPPASPAAGQ